MELKIFKLTLEALQKNKPFKKATHSFVGYYTWRGSRAQGYCQQCCYKLF